MYWIIDSIEDGIAILENPDTQDTKELPKKALPKGAKEGNVLTEDDAGTLHIDHEETAARTARIRERFERLKKG
jgi:hypothetical protein